MSATRRLLLQAGLVTSLGLFAALSPSPADASSLTCWSGSACVPDVECMSYQDLCSGCAEGINLVCEAGSIQNGCAGNEAMMYCGFYTQE